MKNNDLSGTIQHNQYILNSLKDLERILEPNHTSPNVLTYKAKREDCNLPIQTRIHFHNKMNSLWHSASNLLNSLTAEDELHYGLSKEKLGYILNDTLNPFARSLSTMWEFVVRDIATYTDFAKDLFVEHSYPDRKSTRLNSSHSAKSRMPSSA